MILILILIAIVYGMYSYGQLTERYHSKEHIIISFYLLIVFTLLIFLYRIEDANNPFFEYIILFFLLSVYAYGLKSLINKWDKENYQNWEEYQKKIDRRDQGMEELMDIVDNGFAFKNCSRCNDNQYTLVEFNSQGTGVRMVCSTCGSKKWFKSIPNFNSGKKIIALWDDINYLNEYVIGEDKSYFFNITQDDEKDVVSKTKRRKHIPQNIKDKVWNRDGGKCAECGSSEKLEFDHIIPHSKGGADTYRNLQLLCEQCNRSKSNEIGN